MNEGTRTHTIQRLLSLQQYSAQGQKVSTSEVWHAIRTAYVQVNGGEGENLSGMLQGVITPLARVMLATTTSLQPLLHPPTMPRCLISRSKQCPAHDKRVAICNIRNAI